MDPLYEMYPGISSYAYVLNNPIRYVDPTGMTVENNDCGIGCGIRKVFNKMFFFEEKQNPDGTLSSKVSRGTGWKLPKQNKRTKANNNEIMKKNPKQSPVSSLNNIGVVLKTSLPQVKLQNQISISTKILPFEFDGREIPITGPQSVEFNFSTVGGVARNWNGQLSGGKNYILPMSNSQKQNLQAIANYLIANPQATIRFQYPTPGTNFHPAAVKDLREVYQMNFSQITDYLLQLGVTNPNRRILMNYDKGFDFIVNPGK